VDLLNARKIWATTLRVFVVICLLPVAAFGNGKKSPENPTVVLGLLGGASLFWQYVRSRTAR
jgi:hypothetical protein